MEIRKANDSQDILEKEQIRGFTLDYEDLL